ncbi:MAG: MarR family transcriptional regulator [Chthoniobacterales bacterium]
MEKHTYEKLAEFRATLRRFLRFSEEAAYEAGLAPKQHQALLAIKGFSEPQAITIGELARQLQIRHHSAVGIVNRLEKDGCLKRRTSESDRRKVQLNLTRRGDILLERLSSAHHKEMRSIGPRLVDLLQMIIDSDIKNTSPKARHGTKS